MTSDSSDASLGRDVRRPGFDGNEADFLPASLDAAAAVGVSVTFDVYPRHSSCAREPGRNVGRFAAWVAKLAQAYPQVREYVVMNECNTSRSSRTRSASAPGQNQSRPPAAGAFAGRALRRAEGGRPDELRLGPRPLTARKRRRPTASRVTRVRRSPSTGSRFLGAVVRGVREEDAPHGAAHGRARPAPVPGAAVAARSRPGYAGRDVVQRRQPAPRLPGVLRRLRGYRPADARPAGHGCRSASNEIGHPDDILGPRSPAPTTRLRELRRSGGDRRRRSYQATWYIEAASNYRRSAMPNVVEGQHLPARRRAVARRLAERPLLCGVRPEAVGDGVHRRVGRATGGACPTGEADLVCARVGSGLGPRRGAGAATRPEGRRRGRGAIHSGHLTGRTCVRYCDEHMFARVLIIVGLAVVVWSVVARPSRRTARSRW